MYQHKIDDVIRVVFGNQKKNTKNITIGMIGFSNFDEVNIHL